MRTAETATQFLYLSTLRLRESTQLLKVRHLHGAIYLAGYVVECGYKALLAKRHGGRLPGEYQHHDLERLRSSVLPHLRDVDAEILQAIPTWSHLRRYVCAEPDATTVATFINRAKDAHRCLATYL